MFGNAFLIVWNDVASASEDEYRRWHRVEHMPERLAIPGFALGRRYVDTAAAKYRYLTVYEVDGADVFRSEPYRASLASPTPWTTRMSAEMTNFVRRVCRTTASSGVAVGGAVATFTIALDGDAAADRAGAKRLVEAIVGFDGVSAVHLGAVDAETTGERRDAMQSRAQDETPPFNAVLIVEGETRRALAGLLERIGDRLAQFAGSRTADAKLYQLALLYQPSYERP